MKKIFLLMITGILVSLNCFAGEVIYITENGSGDNSGYSWDNAMPGIQLQDAIDTLENSGGEIWVAEGTYIPQKKTTTLQPCSIDKSFELKNGVQLYGGFSPKKGAIDKNTRNPKAYESILSGDINGDDVDYFDQYEPSETRSDNVTHVIIAAYLDDTSILDGFVITGGEAYNGNSSLSSCYHNRGGGLFIKSQVKYSIVDEENKYGPIVRHCTFRNNMASYGGGLFLWTGEKHVAEQYFVIANNVFENNYALIGGGVYAESYYSEEYITQPYFKDNIFHNNYAVFLGGGLFIGGDLNFYSYASTPSFTFVTEALQYEINAKIEGNTFIYNSSGKEGGGFAMNGVGLKENSLIATGNKFIGNTANYGGGCFLQAIDGYYSDGYLDAKFYNNLFANNTANTGGGGINLYEPKTSAQLFATFVNNTIVNNKAPLNHGSALYDETNGSYLIQNSIVWEISENESKSSSSNFQYTAMNDIEDSNGNFNLSDNNEDSKGPNFVQPTSFLGAPTTDEQKIEIDNANWSISIFSPLQEIAKEAYLPGNITTDLAGNVRIIGVLDIGAYEFQGPHENTPDLPEKVQTYVVLTGDYSSIDIEPSSYVLVYGAQNNNIVNVKEYGRVHCMNFVGENEINIQGNSFDFTCYRSGATVYMQSTSGTQILIPATLTPQVIRFSDGSSNLVISSGQIFFGSQIVNTIESSMSSPVNTNDVSEIYFIE